MPFLLALHPLPALFLRKCCGKKSSSFSGPRSILILFMSPLSFTSRLKNETDTVSACSHLACSSQLTPGWWALLCSLTPTSPKTSILFSPADISSNPTWLLRSIQHCLSHQFPHVHEVTQCLQFSLAVLHFLLCWIILLFQLLTVGVLQDGLYALWSSIVFTL